MQAATAPSAWCRRQVLQQYSLQPVLLHGIDVGVVGRPGIRQSDRHHRLVACSQVRWRHHLGI